jgi:L-ascorbate metabolism protein UlaG (beta-lactamase superfamily)
MIPIAVSEAFRSGTPNSAGRTIFQCGESAYFDGFTRIGESTQMDLAMMPIGAYESMSGQDVARG